MNKIGPKDRVLTVDTKGDQVRMWRDQGYKEKSIWIWTRHCGTNNLTATRLNEYQAVTVYEELYRFIYKNSALPLFVLRLGKWLRIFKLNKYIHIKLFSYWIILSRYGLKIIRI